MLFNINELAALRVAKKRKDRGLDISAMDEKIIRQMETGDPVFHKAELYHTANDDYNELWQIEDDKEGNRQFVVRNVYGLPYFAAVCDPLGYCEMDYTIKDKHIFVINDKGKELFGVSNLDGADFPTLEQMCRAEWDRIKVEHPHFEDDTTASWWSEVVGLGSTMTTDKWLISFMDPEQYEKEIKDMYGYEENWVAAMETVRRELIGGFDYLGRNYYIFKETQRHKVCGKEVINYYVDNKQVLGKWDGHVMFLADFCEGECGPMYTKSQAIKAVADALQVIYEGKKISEIHNSYGYVYERFIGYRDAAERLLHHDYNRKHVMNLIAKEKREHSFWRIDDPRIPVKFPGCVRDHDYNYDWCGRRII